jgi:hypothetical protein
MIGARWEPRPDVTECGSTGADERRPRGEDPYHTLRVR